MFFVSQSILAGTAVDAFSSRRKVALDALNVGRDEDVPLDVSRLRHDDLLDLRRAADEADSRKTVRIIDAILSGMSGDFSKTVPSFPAFHSMLVAYLRHGLLSGWVYQAETDGRIYPWLVRDVVYHRPSRHDQDADPFVSLRLTACSRDGNGGNGGFGTVSKAVHFYPGDVTRKRIAQILESVGLYHETSGLAENYQQEMAHFTAIRDLFARQFRVTGKALCRENGYRGDAVEGGDRRVIHDVDAGGFARVADYGPSDLSDDDSGELPLHPILRVFDLKSHEFYWCHSGYMMPYEYDKSLREKLVLPETHRDLLDILTADLGMFTDDIVEGKKAGNILLCKGRPGVGKTLTAEVYAELTEKPLYRVHSGQLGTKASDVEHGLNLLFERNKRWGCVVLLDEADVFVMRRGSDLEQNAIVAEFLRTMEYFDGLMFMTSNRENDIDDAIQARCIAIIHYSLPSPDDAARVWRVMAGNFGCDLSDSMIADLVRAFPSLAQRDIKMLLSLTMRVARGKGVPLDMNAFRKCAIFRNIGIDGGSGGRG